MVKKRFKENKFHIKDFAPKRLIGGGTPTRGGKILPEKADWWRNTDQRRKNYCRKSEDFSLR